MQECEGISTSQSVLIVRFRNLPKVFYYDKACNVSKSNILRWPWVNEGCAIECNRFHYHSQICNSVWDTSSYLLCDEHATSGAEAMNHLLNFSKSHPRFLRPDNLMLFLAAQPMLVNIRAFTRGETGKSDNKVKKFREFVRDKWKCKCKICTS